MTTILKTEVEERRGTALLGEAAIVIWNDIADEGREQFYMWHDREHIPERLSIPGFRRGRRYRRPGHSPEWLTLYEADDLAILTSSTYLARLNSPSPATQRTLQYFRNTSRAACRTTHTVGSSTGGHVLAMRLTVLPEEADAMCAFLISDAFPRAMASPGVVACHLFATDDRASYVNTAESNTRKFDVPSWILVCETSFLAAAEELQRMFDASALARFGVSARKDASIYSLEICRLPQHADVDARPLELAP